MESQNNYEMLLYYFCKLTFNTRMSNYTLPTLGNSYTKEQAFNQANKTVQQLFNANHLSCAPGLFRIN